MISLNSLGKRVKDLVFSTDLTIDPATGDFKVDYSDNQHVTHLFLLDLGQLRQFPLIGIGILKQIKGSISITNLKQKIRRNLTADNYGTPIITIDRFYNIITSQTRLK